MSEQVKKREAEVTVEIAVPVETVWRELTEAEGIVRWFAPEAKVVPGEGGSIWLSWGPGMEGSARIEIWEPNRHLRTVDTRENPYDEPGEVRMAVDYYLEAKGSGTVLRLVHSGFGASTAWDNEYEGTEKGWRLFFNVLQFGLEQHPGEPARQLTLTVTSPYSREETWAKLLGPEFLGASELIAGERFTAKMGNGEALTGRVRSVEAPGTLGLTVENWNHALFALFNEHFKSKVAVTAMLVLYGTALAQADETEERLQSLLRQVLPEAKPAGVA